MAGKAFSKSSVAYFYILEFASAFVLSAAHNVLFFVLDIKLIATSFSQFVFTYLFLKALQFANFIPKVQSSQTGVFLAAGTKCLEVIIASFANSHNRTGELFLVRTFDFLFAGAVLVYYISQTSGKVITKCDLWLIGPLAVFTSLSWFEPGQIEFTLLSFSSAVVLPFVRAISFISLKKAMESSGRGHLNILMLEYTRLVSLFLIVPAFLSYSRSYAEVSASWESIDYVLMALSFIFMVCNLYSQLWLTLTLNPNHFLALENSRNLLASCSQWMIQNMAHPNLIAFGAKIVSFASLFQIWTRYSC